MENTNLNQKHTFVKFHLNDGNSFARSVALAVADEPSLYNPVFFYGVSGSGKTHLLNAIGNYVVMKNPDMHVFYATAEMFIDNVIEMVRNGSMESKTALRARYRDVDVLLFDDIQFIEGKNFCAGEFAATLDELLRNGKQVVLSADKAPNEFKECDERLCNRLISGIVADLGIPDWPWNEKIVREKAMERGILLEDSLVQYIGETHCTSLFELEGVLTNLKAYSEFTNTVITLDIARKVLMAEMSK